MLADRLPADFSSVVVNGRVEVLTVDGQPVGTPSFQGLPMTDRHGRRCVRLWADYLVNTGEYRVRITLSAPNADLGPQPGALVFVNEPCGCELISALFLRLVGGGCAVLALPFLILGTFRLLARRSSHAAPLA